MQRLKSLSKSSFSCLMLMLLIIMHLNHEVEDGYYEHFQYVFIYIIGLITIEYLFEFLLDLLVFLFTLLSLPFYLSYKIIVTFYHLVTRSLARA